MMKKILSASILLLVVGCSGTDAPKPGFEFAHTLGPELLGSDYATYSNELITDAIQLCTACIDSSSDACMNETITIQSKYKDSKDELEKSKKVYKKCMDPNLRDKFLSSGKKEEKSGKGKGKGEGKGKGDSRRPVPSPK